MDPLQIAEKLKEKFPEDVLGHTEFRGQVSVTVNKNNIASICKAIHDDPALKFDYLKDLTAVDWLGKKDVRFEVVYNLYSMTHHHFIRLKAAVSEADCTIDSVVPVWRGADWHERECFDMFGIKFNGHHDLRRILMPEDWQGFPLRKDYPIKGPSTEWPGWLEVLDKAEKFKEYEWNN